jgi:hypothetical protein
MNTHDSTDRRFEAVSVGVALVDSARQESDRALERLSERLAQEGSQTEGELARYMVELRSVFNHIEQRALQVVVDATPMRQESPTRANLERHAIEQVLGSTEWHSAESIGLKRKPDASNPHAIVSRWLGEGKLFAIEREGKRFYPAYAFDEFWSPRPVIGAVVKAFGGASPFRLASWFCSASSFLKGERPMDLVASRPQDVLRAAQDHLQGPIHG